MGVYSTNRCKVNDLHSLHAEILHAYIHAHVYISVQNSAALLLGCVQFHLLCW